MPTTATDTELVRQYLAGDQRALGDIYERYGDRAYDLCFAMLRSGDDAADAYQDTFLTAANKLDQLRDTERPDPGCTPWLAINAVLDFATETLDSRR